jgi:hypothetical protein
MADQLASARHFPPRFPGGGGGSDPDAGRGPYGPVHTASPEHW